MNCTHKEDCLRCIKKDNCLIGHVIINNNIDMRDKT